MMVAEDKGSGIKIVVYELDSKMTSQKQVFTTSLNYMPVFRDMLPLGIGGFTEKGHFFMIELNSPVNGNCESKPIDSLIVNPRNGSKVSLTACKMHTNLISIYMGSKEG